jgi:hypothetical protein
MSSAREEVLFKLADNLLLAHQTLFAGRHPQATPDMHWRMISDFHSSHPRICTQAFRGAAKSSIGEEGIVIGAAYRMFRNCLILGDTEDRAIDRLRAIKHEFETNEGLEAMFGSLKGAVWQQTKIVLSNGVVIQAYGRDQALRGCKHHDLRPDFCFGDDIENEESCADEAKISNTMKWLLAVVIPALDINYRMRINGTPLHPRAMICQIAEDRTWVSRIYPIEYLDAETGERKATWEARYPLKWIDEKRQSYERHGYFNHFAQEYLCKAEDPQSKVFTKTMFNVEPTVRTWQPVYAMFDPARTKKDTSATTGYAAWSWINRRMIVWEARALLAMPDEIVSEIFRVDEEYRPIVTGVELDGLEEFLMQPLRQEQLRRGYAVPIRGMRAPKGKLDFIKGLQPFFKAKEIILAKNCPDLVAQFLSFPNGRIDVPNALAYALMLRPGQPIYDGFQNQHIVEDLPMVARQPCYLAVNATGGCTTAALLQMVDGGLLILADWVREGDPGSNLDTIMRESTLAGHGRVKLFAPPRHFTPYDLIGLRAAARAIPTELGRGGQEHAGREELRGLMARLTKGRPMIQVSTAARWTLNALSGGYCREVTRSGQLTDQAIEGPYRTLMEGIESLASLTKSITLRDDDDIRYDYTPDGRRFISSRVAGHG